MKRTAVQWLYESLILNESNPAYNSWVLDKALEMEKEQIKFFFEKGHLYSGCPYGLDEVYNKTYNNEQRK